MLFRSGHRGGRGWKRLPRRPGPRSDADLGAPGPGIGRLRASGAGRRHSASRKGCRGTAVGGCVFGRAAAVHRVKAPSPADGASLSDPGNRAGAHAACEGCDGLAATRPSGPWRSSGRKVGRHHKLTACDAKLGSSSGTRHGTLHPPPTTPGMCLKSCRPSARTRCTPNPQGGGDGMPGSDTIPLATRGATRHLP